MADTPAQAALREAFNSKLSVIPQTLSQEKQTQAQTNIGGPFLPLSGGTVSGTIAATGFSGPLDGNASTASKWATARTITLSGDATGSVSFDGSANASLNLTIANSSVTNVMLAASSVTFSKVASADIATQAEAEAGTANDSFMTPLRVAQAIDAKAGNATSYVTDTYYSGKSWLRYWSDYSFEQGGYAYCEFGKTVTISLIRAALTTNYSIVLGNVGGAESMVRVEPDSQTVTSFSVTRYYTGGHHGSGYFYWVAMGK